MTRSKVFKWWKEFCGGHNDWTCWRFWLSTNSQNWNNGEHVSYFDLYRLLINSEAACSNDGHIGREYSFYADWRFGNAIHALASVNNFRNGLTLPHLEKKLARRQPVPWLCHNGQWDQGLSSNPATKHEGTKWKTSSSPSPKKIYQTKSPTKVLLNVFFHKDSVIYRHVSSHTTITTNADIKILQSVRRHLWSKCSGLAHSFILQHDNTCPHTAKATSPKITRCCHTHPIVRIWPLVIFGCLQLTVVKLDVFHKWGHPLGLRLHICSQSGHRIG